MGTPTHLADSSLDGCAGANSGKQSTTSNKFKKKNVLNADKSNLQEHMTVKINPDTMLDVILTVEYHNHCAMVRRSLSASQDEDLLGISMAGIPQSTRRGNSSGSSSSDQVYLLHESRKSYEIGTRAQLRFSFEPPGENPGSKSPVSNASANTSWKWESYYGSEFSIIYRVRLIVHEKQSGSLQRIWGGIKSMVSMGDSRNDGESLAEAEDPLVRRKNSWGALLSPSRAKGSGSTRYVLPPNSRMMSQQILVLHFHPALRSKGSPLVMKLQSPPSKLLSFSHMDGSLSLKVTISGSIYHTKDTITGSIIFYKQRLGRIRNVTMCLLRREEQHERYIPLAQMQQGQPLDDIFASRSPPTHVSRYGSMNSTDGLDALNWEQESHDEENLNIPSSPSTWLGRLLTPTKSERHSSGEAESTSSMGILGGGNSDSEIPSIFISSPPTQTPSSIRTKARSENTPKQPTSATPKKSRTFAQALRFGSTHARAPSTKINPLPNNPIKLLMRYEILDGTPEINEEIPFRVPLSACDELTPSFVHVEDATMHEGCGNVSRETLRDDMSSVTHTRWLLSSVRYYIVIMISSQSNQRYFCEREFELYRYNPRRR